MKYNLDIQHCIGSYQGVDIYEVENAIAWAERFENLIFIEKHKGFAYCNGLRLGTIINRKWQMLDTDLWNLIVEYKTRGRVYKKAKEEKKVQVINLDELDNYFASISLDLDKWIKENTRGD